MSHEAITEAVQALERLDLPSLRKLWRARWGEPPGYRSRDLLCRAFAHRVQVEAWGDLPMETRRQAVALARRYIADPSFSPNPGPVLKPGSTLIREWAGLRHEVAVTEDGFAYRGEKFGSLSPIAQRITGTKWNGLVFFGLKPRSATVAK